MTQAQSRHLTTFRVALLALGLAAGALLVGSPSGGGAQDGKSDGRYDVKASYIHSIVKLGRFGHGLEPSEQRDIKVCLWNAKEIAAAFDSIDGKRSANVRISVEQIGTARELERCQLVFFPAAAKQEIPAALQAVSGKGILTFGEIPEFCSMGGQFNFFEESGTVKIEMSSGKLAQENISVHHKLRKIMRECALKP